MPANLFGGFEVGLDDGGFQVLLRLVPAGIDINRDERFGLVDADVAAAFQPDLPAERVLDLFLDVELCENRRRLGVKLASATRQPADLANHVADLFVARLTVNKDAVNFLGEEVAHGAFEEARFLEYARRHRAFLDFLFNIAPGL